MIHNNWVTTDDEPKKATELAEKNKGNLICWSLMTFTDSCIALLSSIEKISAFY